MALRPVDITSGQVSGVDDLSAAPSLVANWEIDESGINRPRPRNTALTMDNQTAASTRIIGHTYWPGQGGHLVMVNDDGEVYTASDSVPGTAFLRSDSTSGTRCTGSAPQITFVHGKDHIYMCRGGVGGGVARWTPSEVLADALPGGGFDATHIATIGRRIIQNSYLGDRNLFSWSDPVGEGAWSNGPITLGIFNEPDSRPDPIQGLYDNGTELFVFGTQTLQVYGVGLDPAIPFEMISALNVGCASPFAAVRLESQFAFLDHNRNVAMTDGRGVEVIGDAIKSTISGLDYIEDAFMWREVRDQYSLIGLRFPTEARTFVFDEKGKRWSEHHDYDGVFVTGSKFNSYAYWPKYNRHTFSNVDTGGLFYRGVSGGDGVVCRRTTGWQDHGSMDRKRSLRVRVVFRRGTTVTGGTPGAVEVRVQNQDGPWSPWKQASIGASTDYDQTRDLFFGGIFKRRRYDVRFSTAENMSLVGLYDDVAEMSP